METRLGELLLLRVVAEVSFGIVLGIGLGRLAVGYIGRLGESAIRFVSWAVRVRRSRQIEISPIKAIRRNNQQNGS